MKRIILVAIVLLTIQSVLAQSQFSKGFKVGYEEGWCYDRGIGCIPPIPPIAPIPQIGENTNSYKDGYQRGFTMGQRDSAAESSNNSSQPRTRQRYQTDKPIFDDFHVYNPNYELLAKVLEQRQRQALKFNQYHEEKEERIKKQVYNFLAQKEYKKALDIANRIERPISKYSMIARIYQEKGDIIDAYNYFYKCQSYELSEEDRKDLNEELNTLSEAINVKFNKAIQKDEFNKALFIARFIENTVYSYTLQGYVYYVQRDFENAKNFFKAIKKQSKYAKDMLKKIKKEEKSLKNK